MKRYSITDPLHMAFYAREIYQDVVLAWRGFGLLYMLSLVALCTIPGMVKFHNQLGSFVTNDAPAYIRQMPTLTLAKGSLSVPENRPYIITDPATNEAAMVIDTSGKYQTLEQSKSKLLLTSGQLHIQTGTEPVAMSLSQIDDMTLTREKMYEMLEVLAEWAAITFYPAAVILAYVYRLIQMIFFACLTLVYARIAGIPMRFAAGMRLAAIAMTPMIAAFTLTGFFDVPVPLPWLIGTALTISYIMFGVRSAAAATTGHPSQES